MSELSTEEMVVHFDPTEEGAGGVSAAAAGGAGGAQELGRRLLAAARDGHSTAVLDLMAQGAPFTTDWLGTSPLHLAAANNQVNVCAVLLRAGASRDCRTKVDRTPLHLAAYWGHAEVCDLLLRRGAQVMARDMLRMTPLHWAAERGHAAAAGVLLRAGADTEALSKFGATPRTLALAAGRQDLLRLMDEPRDPPHQDTEEAHDESAQAAEYVAMEELDGIPYTKLPEQAEEAPEDTSGAEETDGDGASTGRVESGAARLLRRHGITMLPAEPPGTALRALQAGRTILLSDAGKLMLKESVAETSPAPPSPSSPPGGGEGEGVVLTATPVTSPPRGVKVFTIGNKLAKDHKMQGIKKVQYVSVTGGGGRAPKPLKILVNKHNLERLLTTAKGPAPAPASPAPVPPPPPPPDPADEAVVRVPEQFLRSTDPSYLRAQLLAATAALHRATRQLAQLRATSQRH